MGTDRGAAAHSSTQTQPVLPIGRFLDGLMMGGLFAFGAWTLLYHLALADVIGSGVAFIGWLVLLIPLGYSIWRVVMPWVRTWDAAPWPPQVVLAGIGAAAAALIVRPDLDDASYVVRSTWIAEHGDVNFGDAIFTDNVLGPLPGQTAYLPSIEALFGWISRVTGLNTADVVYKLFPPLAAFAAVWAIGMVFRGWQARRPVWCLSLAVIFLAWGGADHASWGNLSVARIWQGKVVMLALVVPLLFALLGFVLRAESRRDRVVGLGTVGVVGITAVGLSSTAMFVIPGIGFLAAIAGLAAGRWKLGGAIFVVVSVYPMLAGIATILSIDLAGADTSLGQDPWTKVLGAGGSSWIVYLAFLFALLGALWPSRFSGTNFVGRWVASGAVGVAGLIALSVTYQIAVGILGTDLVAWRLTWIVPVPVMVGLLASLPWPTPAALAVPVICAGALISTGLPLWSPANAGAAVGAPLEWKLFPSDVSAAQWLAGQDPTGSVLAPVGIGTALEVLTARYTIVGSRPDYMAAYLQAPQAQAAQRIALQRLVEGSTDPADVDGTADRLAMLDVEFGCFADTSTTAREVLTGAGFVPAYAQSGITCLRVGSQ